MEKILDLRRSVWELTKEYPELIGIMSGLGFTEITKKVALETVGKIMTIPKGAVIKGIPMDKVIFTLMENGFTLSGSEKASFAGGEAAVKNASEQPVSGLKKSDAEQEKRERLEQLKSYLRRLGEGEDLEAVKADFAEKFSQVEATEIMKAEQALLQEGTPLEEVQRLCDVHSALFHGATREEQIANAEKEVEASLQRTGGSSRTGISGAGSPAGNIMQEKMARAAALTATEGHPLYTFTKENEQIAVWMEKFRKEAEAGEDVTASFLKLRELSVHYAKKGDLLYPHLKVKYDVTGPSDVMWTVDDEIRDEMGILAGMEEHGTEWMERAGAVLKRAEEMIYKETNILFPICAVNFSQEEWIGIYRDSKDYDICMDVENSVWKEAEMASEKEKTDERNNMMSGTTGEIVMPGGHMNLEQLTAVLNTIPMEISFVDADNINRFFNEGPKVFKRPGMAVDREVFSCHPPKIEPMVRAIIDDFRNGARDQVQVWMQKGGRTMLVTYMAVRNKEKEYLGTMELVQDMEEIKKHFLPEN